MKPCRILVFAKAPVPGQVKTRLIPALGREGAAALALEMFHHTVDEARAAAMAEIELCVGPAPDSQPWQPWFTNLEGVHWSDQGEGDLGVRLARATRRAIGEGRSVLLIGTDCPALSAQQLKIAAELLAIRDAVMIPSLDGGYVLLGLNEFHPSVFEGIDWGGDAVAAQTRARLSALQWSLGTLPPLRDIDLPKDLEGLPASWGSRQSMTL